jgi:hypothetical protein
MVGRIALVTLQPKPLMAKIRSFSWGKVQLKDRMHHSRHGEMPSIREIDCFSYTLSVFQAVWLKSIANYLIVPFRTRRNLMYYPVEWKKWVERKFWHMIGGFCLTFRNSSLKHRIWNYLGCQKILETPFKCWCVKEHIWCNYWKG